MIQLTLIETESTPVEYIKNGILHRNHGHWEERNFHGFRQTRYKGDNWRFYIAWFSGPPLADGTDSIGKVQLWDGRLEPCQMDMDNRVKINGKWYDHQHWDH